MGKCNDLFIKSIKINNVNEFLKVYEESQCILNEKDLLKQVMYCNKSQFYQLQQCIMNPNFINRCNAI